MKRSLLSLAGLLIPLTLHAAPEEPRFPFVLPWDDASPGVTDMSPLLEKPAGAHGFIQSRDGHFFAGDKRVRFFGVNTVFGANFPTHEAAEKIAARMAKFGINCVRFHHMDCYAAPRGIWSADMRTLDAGQLDKLDYFIAQLKAHGIYADLNLHVSRAYPGAPAWKEAPHYFKGVDLFYPQMLEMQRDYARQLLRHVNPYTHTAYAEEPAIALVEINNEDGLISEWWKGALDTMPEPYHAALEAPWNRWLQTRYPSQTALEKAWNISTEPLEGELLREGDFANGLGSAWFLEQHEGAKASAANVDADGGKGLRVHVEKPGSATWHVQLSQPKLALAQDKPYTLTFRARTSGAPRHLSVTVSQAHAPWRQLWSAAAVLTPAWQEYRFTLELAEGDANARVVFSNLGEAGTDFDFSALSLRPGGRFGLEEGERLGTLPFFQKSSFASRTPAAQRDWMRFLWETEDAYWTGIRRFLKEEIKTRSLLVGTAAEFSTPLLQAKLDVVDSHAYWQHPHFPGKPWDPANWTVQNISMAGSAGGGVLPSLALRRVEGKPFVCTEYNAPAPNSYAAETFLLSNAFAGTQDWDALFAFDYSSRMDDWDSRRIAGFFDIDQDPAKMVTLPAAVAMFVRGDVAKAAATKSVPVTMEQALETCRRFGPWWNTDVFDLPRETAFAAALQMRLGGSSATPEPSTAGTPPQFSWDSGHARATLDSPRSKAFVGQGSGEAVALGEVTVGVQGWAALAFTAIDGPDFHSTGRILISAVGSVENTGMHWTNAEKNSVGRDWGTAPSLAQGIATQVTLPVPASRLKAWALDERGQRGKEISVSPKEAGAALELKPEYQTLWYEVEIRP